MNNMELLTGLTSNKAAATVEEWWATHYRAGRQPLLLLPSRTDVWLWTRRLARIHGALLGRGGAATLDDLVAQILAPNARASSGRTLGAFGHSLLVLRAGMHQWERPGSVLGRMSRPVPVINAVFNEMHESGLSPDEIVAALDKWSRSTTVSLVRALASELRDLYHEYNLLCSQLGVMGWARRTAEAAAGAEREECGNYSVGPVACFGFLTFSPAQRRLLSQIGRRAPVLIELPWRGHPSTRFLDDEYRAWLALGAKQRHHEGVEVTSSPGPEFRILQSSGKRGELELVAAEIVELLRDGLDPSQVLVVVRRESLWARLALDVFGRYGIPVNIEARIRLGTTGVGSDLVKSINNGDVRKSRSRALSPEALLDFVLAQERILAESSAEDVVYAAVAGRALGVIRRIASELDLVLSACPELCGLEHHILDLIGATPVPLPRDLAHAVQVASAAHIRARNAEVTFILGLVDQEFPERGPEWRFLPPSLRRDCLRCTGLPLLRDEPEGIDDLLFELAVQSASRVVYMSQRLVDDEGQPLIPSPYVQGILDRTPGLHQAWRTRTLADTVFPPNFAPSSREFLRSCQAFGVAQVGQSTYETFSAHRACVSVELHAPDVREWLASRFVFGASEIEEFAHCPLRWFFQHAVGVEVPVEEGDPRQVGACVHDALARVYRKLAACNLLPITPERLPSALAVVENVLDDIFENAAGRSSLACSDEGTDRSAASRRLLRARVREMVAGALSFDAQRDAGATPCATEWSLPCEGVPIGNGIRVRGRIDRLDVLADGSGVVVIDYKTGSPRIQTDWVRDGALQVPLYMLTLASESPDVRVAGGGYLFLTSRQFHAVVCEDAKIGEEPFKRDRICRLDDVKFWTFLEECRAKAVECVEAMKGCVYAPGDSRRCLDGCSLRSVCRQSSPYARSQRR